ncbi:RelA/SpoT domain-containing protein [Microbacterium sp. NPDC077486]|uniref:GTP pyrophosphokinase n=1 Tax=Microbacterium sp. NPDC077486 TaxID=3154766 RepID=UPI003440EBA9
MGHEAEGDAKSREGSAVESIDFSAWDWLPTAAVEMQAYVLRLLEESGINPHDVTARAKSITSFRRKQEAKRYADPRATMTDIVAVRVITYSVTDRDRTCDLLRQRFQVLPGEDKNPGDVKPPHLRGYDCQHLVVSRENEDISADWLTAGGKLEQYFQEFGGLEIQVRTVAGHAWAEFEHARRYKGTPYRAIGEQDRGTIDQLFGAAADARRALDETFVAIDRILARPSMEGEVKSEQHHPVESLAPGSNDLPLTHDELDDLLRERYPKDRAPSPRGLDFGMELVGACGLLDLGALDRSLSTIDSAQVEGLMDRTAPVTRVRRLDDDLLAYFGEMYVALTRDCGSVSARARQLEWRYDRLRGKLRPGLSGQSKASPVVSED